jgi:hypothetical protein
MHGPTNVSIYKFFNEGTYENMAKARYLRLCPIKFKVDKVRTRISPSKERVMVMMMISMMIYL